MARDPVAFLDDILESARAIRRYIRGGKRAFLGDEMARDAVIARLIMIGEAIKTVQAQGVDLAVEAPGVAWAAAARTRDRLAHQYWRTDPEIVWNVAAKDLRALCEAVAAIRRRRLRRRRRS